MIIIADVGKWGVAKLHSHHSETPTSACGIDELNGEREQLQLAWAAPAVRLTAPPWHRPPPCSHATDDTNSITKAALGGT